MPDSFLREEIKRAINRCSRENASNTPDGILADYLMRCLENWELTMSERQEWHKEEESPDANQS